MATVTVRFWASARAAAGRDAETVDGDTPAAVLATVVERHGERLRRVLAVSSLLVDGEPCPPERRGRALADGAVLEVLPPFAGG